MYPLDSFFWNHRSTNLSNLIITLHIITAECHALGDWQRHWWGSPIAISEASDNTSHSVSNVCLKRLSLHHFQSLIFQAAWFQIQLHFRLSWARSCALLWSPVPSVTDFKVRAKGKCQHQSCSWFSWVLWLWQSEFHWTPFLTGSTYLP